MADLRISSGSQALTPAQPSARTDAVKAAQRAFFNAALAQVQAPSDVRRSVEQPRSDRQGPAPLTAASTTPSGSSAGPLRPGSLLDIKV